MKYRAVTYPILGIQFWVDKKKKVNMFTITSNPEVEGENFYKSVMCSDRWIFVRKMAEDPLCSKEEKLWLCDFFDEVRKELLK